MVRGTDEKDVWSDKSYRTLLGANWSCTCTDKSILRIVCCNEQIYCLTSLKLWSLDTKETDMPIQNVG